MSWRPRGAARADLRDRQALNAERYGTVDERADRVREALYARCMQTTAELRDATGFPGGVLGGALHRLAERGDAHKVGDRWTLA